MGIALISHPDCLRHDLGPGHPEAAARLEAVLAELDGSDLPLQRHPAPLAERAQLERAHDAAYLQAVFDAAPASGRVVLDPDTSMNPHSLTAARRAAGAAVLGVDLVMAGGVRVAFGAVRPPGHHAERGRAMGFCIFNNVAVGAAHALAAHGLARVAVVDFDVHHGNGTEDIFRGEPRVLLCSSFQHPYYPFSGVAPDNPQRVAMPLTAGGDGSDFRAAWRAQGLPALAAFRPELLMVSAGFDAHRDDPLAGLNLDEDDYAWLGGELRALAARHAQGRVISLLEGGYHPPALARCVVAYLKALAN